MWSEGTHSGLPQKSGGRERHCHIGSRRNAKTLRLPELESKERKQVRMVLAGMKTLIYRSHNKCQTPM